MKSNGIKCSTQQQKQQSADWFYSELTQANPDKSAIYDRACADDKTGRLYRINRLFLDCKQAGFTAEEFEAAAAEILPTNERSFNAVFCVRFLLSIY